MTLRQVLATGTALVVTLGAASSAQAHTPAHTGHVAQVMSERPSLEQIAYLYWGQRLQDACPGGSLHFVLAPHSPRPGGGDAQGGSWGDCHPWVRSGHRLEPEICDTALHEAGHEAGLPDTPGTGTLMDNTRMIISSGGWLNGKWMGRTWVGIENVCQPGHVFRARGVLSTRWLLRHA